MEAGRDNFLTFLMEQEERRGDACCVVRSRGARREGWSWRRRNGGRGPGRRWSGLISRGWPWWTLRWRKMMLPHGGRHSAGLSRKEEDDGICCTDGKILPPRTSSGCQRRTCRRRWERKSIRWRFNEWDMMAVWGFGESGLGRAMYRSLCGRRRRACRNQSTILSRGRDNQFLMLLSH